MEITTELLNKYLGRDNTNSAMAEAKKAYNAMAVHADGKFPEKLIAERRPNESEHTLAYRRKIYEPKTKQPVGKVVTELSKIRRSTDWKVSYEATKPNSNIADSETMEQYCEKNFPQFSSITNWAFTLLLRKYLIDANAVVLVVPINREAQGNEYLKPFPTIYHSDKVVAYVESELLIVKPEPETTIGEQGHVYTLPVYLVANETEIRYMRQSEKGGYDTVWQYFHKLGFLPARKTGGIIKDMVGSYVLHESRIAAMLPDLNEYVREYSDLQAEIVQHVYSERWEYGSQQCMKCRNEAGISSGRIKTGTGKTAKFIECTDCKGTGVIGSSPYRKIIVRAANTNLGEQPSPTPPAGFVEKSTEIAVLQDKRLRERSFDALASINMQFLEQVPLSTSGEAKQVDRDALNNFVYSIAEDIVGIMDWLYFCIARYRYTRVAPTVSGIQDLLPTIAVPEKYDLLSSEYLVDEIQKAKTSKVNGVIVNALELDYVGKKFYNSPEVRDELQCVLTLDPMPQTSEDEKMVRFQNDGVSYEDYVISCNIQAFVRRAISEDEGFVELPDQKQYEQLQQYAQEKIKTIEARSKAKEYNQNPPIDNPIGA